jgi:hypothetical protein
VGCLRIDHPSGVMVRFGAAVGRSPAEASELRLGATMRLTMPNRSKVLRARWVHTLFFSSASGGRAAVVKRLAYCGSRGRYVPIERRRESAFRVQLSLITGYDLPRCQPGTSCSASTAR